MSTVQEIQEAFLHLSESDRQTLRDWICEQQDLAWDEQIGKDFDAGKLDVLMQRARDEAKRGELRPGP